jgi:hypothetical protein
MSKLDDALHDALSEEDAEFLERFEREPGSVQQVLGIFRGPFAWFHVLLVATAVVLGPLGLYCVWRFAGATELRALLYWGAGTAFCLGVVGVVRLLLFMHVQTNRVIREVKRLELQVARLAARDTA